MADHSGQFMLALWEWDGNARTTEGVLRASVPRERLAGFREFLNERGWVLIEEEAAPGQHVYCRATPES
jgi:hypothetical protein